MDSDSDRSSKLNRAGAIFLILAVLAGLFTVHVLTSPAGTFAIRFNPFAILSVTTVLLNVGLLLYFVRKPARTDERIWLSAYTITLAIFCAAEMMQRLSANVEGAIFWHNVEAMGVMVGSMLYLFVLSYTSKSERRYSGTIAFVLIAAPMLTLYFNMTDLIFPHAVSDWLMRPWGWDYNIRALGHGIWFDFLWFNGFLILTLERLFRFRHNTRSPLLRKQAMMFILGSTIPFILGTSTDIALPFFGVNILPLALTFESFGAATFIFATLRYQLLTISPTLFANTILSIMQEAVVATNDKLAIIFMNAKAETLLGVKNTNNRDTPLPDLVSDKYKDEFSRAFSPQQSPDGNVSLAHVDIKQSHGEPTPVRVAASKLRLGNDDTWIMALTDISNELHTQSIIEHQVKVRTQELNEARAYLVSSINSLTQGFILVDRNANIVLTNMFANKLLGESAKEAIGQRANNVLGKLPLNVDLAKSITQVLDSGHTKQHEVVATDGSTYQVYVTPVISGQHVLGAAVVIQDITEAKILERSRDEFFSIASHELRTPLTAIRGNMSMAEDYYDKELKDPSLRELISDSHEASVRLISIVNDFLDSSKLEQGKMVFNLSPVKLAPLVSSVSEELRTLSTEQHNTVKFEDLEKLPTVTADEARLRQIIYNLISNANKYAERATITVKGSVEDHKVHLRITDTGKGISPENQKLLFHKFQQAGESTLTRDNTKGTGLGLYISRLLATNMHCTLELEHSEEGKGSTFLLTLPVAQPKG